MFNLIERRVVILNFEISPKKLVQKRRKEMEDFEIKLKKLQEEGRGGHKTGPGGVRNGKDALIGEGTKNRGGG